MMPPAIGCSGCGKPDEIVVIGIDLFATLGRYQSEEDNLCRWACKCFACGAKMSINDAARDQLFGTGWRSAPIVISSTVDAAEGRR